MPIKTSQVRLPFDHSPEQLAAVLRRMRLDEADILRKSLDARGRRRPVWVYTLGRRDAAAALVPRPGRCRPPGPVVVVGSGPAGLFAADWLAQHGLPVTLLEQGGPLPARARAVARVCKSGVLDAQSHICFGAGGAGAFSDGKLTSRARPSPELERVLDTLVELGAPASIRYHHRPHLGTDGIRRLIARMLARLLQAGVAQRFGQRVASLELRGGAVEGVVLADGSRLPCAAVLLCVGHGARPLFRELERLGVPLELKPFAAGARLLHHAATIDRLQLGRFAGHPALGAAAYRLAETWAEGEGQRACYSFCACPGGYLLNAATEPDGVVTNGMSSSRRNGTWTNAAVVVNVEPRDLPGAEALRGLDWQRALEREAARAVNRGPQPGHALPGQRLLDFLAGRSSERLPAVSALAPVRPAPLHQLLPPFIVEAMGRGLERAQRRRPGLICAEAVLVGVETRTSSPLRIVRDPASRQSPAATGLFPAGEGAGYAGGIVSSAVDGLRAAEALLAGCAGGAG